MRLLKSRDFELSEFVGDEVPPYAILSHTWGLGEVLFADVQRGDFRALPGFAKLRGACEQAEQDGLDWVWVDTCCIDKSSSAELSEAINSMYSWYRNAEVCYVFLCDVAPLDPFIDRRMFAGARWFTRGWCLQELIAPREMEFYTEEWEELGTRWSLQDLISDITSIPAEVLLQKKPPTAYPVAQRMSWASRRSTKREEDMAYCLLGIFDINMPLMYGEGRKAFIRLQEEIMRREVDYSIFLWSSKMVFDDTGLLCDSPHYFSTEGVPIRSGGHCKYSELGRAAASQDSGYGRIKPPESTPRGLEMTLLTKEFGLGRKLAFIYLKNKDAKLICLALTRQSSDHRYYRNRAGSVELVDNLGHFEEEYVCTAAHTDMTIPEAPRQSLELRIWLKSAPEEKLRLMDIYPGHSLQRSASGAYYSTVLNLASCPEFLVLLFGAEKRNQSNQFVVAFNLFDGSWACKVRRYGGQDGSLESVAAVISEEIESVENDTDRPISRLPSRSFVTVAAKRRARIKRSDLYVALIPTTLAADASLSRSIVSREPNA